MAHRNRWFTELKNGGFCHGYVSHNQMVNPIKPPLNHRFPMVFLWFSYGFKFSYGFPMVVAMFSQLAGASFTSTSG